MNGILIYDKESAKYNQDGIKIYLEEAKKHAMKLRVVYYEDLSYGIKDSKYCLWEKDKAITNLEFAINRCRDYRLSKHMEFMGIRVFNNSFVNKIGNHKWDTYQYLAQYNISMPDTKYIVNCRLQEYLKAIENDVVVVKAVHGHGGSQVCLYQPKERKQIPSICKIMDGEDVVIQPYIKGRGQDLRVYIIGNQIIGAVLRMANEDFRSNYSLGGKVRFYDLSKKEIETVEDVMCHFSLDYVGIDFLVQEDGTLLFNEIEDIVGARMLYQCSDIDPIRMYIKYIYKTLSK